MKDERIAVGCLVLVIFLSLGSSIPTTRVPLAFSAADYIPLKWGLIVLGNFEYYKYPPGQNAIQKTEHWIQSEGVPYDVIDNHAIQGPTDTPALGMYPLQYSNGKLRYGIFIIIMNNFKDSKAVNVNYIYWAVGNGTNAVIMGEAAKYVPELLNVTSTNVSYFIDYSITSINYNVLREFDDGIEKYALGDCNVTFPNYYTMHANVTDPTGKTIWYTCTSNTGKYWIGMMNTTYGSGMVFWNSNIPSSDSFLWYSTFYIYWDAFRIIAHSIRFMFEQVKTIDFGLQGYKRWRGAITYRLDQDYPIPLTKSDEEALKAGWYVDMVAPALGYLTTDGNLSDGVPSGYVGAVSSATKWGTFESLVVSTEPLVYTSRNFTIYPSTEHGNYDTMQVDWNQNQNFTDDKEYGIWENQTDPSIMGTYSWCYIDNFTNPLKVSLEWQCSMRDRITDFSWWKTMGEQGYIRYGLHGLTHIDAGDASLVSAYLVCNGSAFIFNQTWIEEQFTEARNELAYCLGSSGNGFDADRVLVSHGGNEYQSVVDSALFNLTWVYLTYGDNDKNEPGWFVYDGRITAMTCGANRGYPEDPKGFEALQDAVKTLFPVMGVYEHNWGYYNLSFDVLPSDTAFSDMFCFAHLDDSFEFWSNSRYLWTNTQTASYENNKIVLEYNANDTLKDYVWRFPVTYNGQYFNGFSDNRSSGKIMHIDGKYVYVEFSEGGNEKLEVTYGTKPHVLRISNYIENITETYTPKNLTLHLWNASGTANVVVDCTRLERPANIDSNGVSIDFVYDQDARTAYFNVTLNGDTTVGVFWNSAPPDPPSLLAPTPNSRYDSDRTLQFEWQYNDVDTADTQQAYRLQLSKDYDFASLIVDTGKVISASAQTDLNLPKDVGLYYWRVTTWDNHDSEGDWSLPQPVIVDMLRISTESTFNGRANVGEATSVSFLVNRQYDNSQFDQTKGLVYINGLPAAWDDARECWSQNVTSETVEKRTYQVSKIVDYEYNITKANDSNGTQQLIWDRVVITITPAATSVLQGNQVGFSVTAVYAYDGKPVSQLSVAISRDGTYFARNNFTDLSDTSAEHEYTTESVAESIYGLTAFSSNSVTVNWTPKPWSGLIMDWISSNAIIIVAIAETVAVVSVIYFKERKKN